MLKGTQKSLSPTLKGYKLKKIKTLNLKVNSELGFWVYFIRSLIEEDLCHHRNSKEKHSK
jgi:hypothetical protein